MATFTIVDTTLRTALKTALLTAVPTLTKIYDDDPYTPNNGLELPIGFISLSSLEPTQEIEGVAVAQIGMWFKYELTVLSHKPTTGTLQAAKVTLANAILAQLYTATTFSGYLREPGIVEFDSDTTVESAEPIYAVRVGMNILTIMPEL